MLADFLRVLEGLFPSLDPADIRTALISFQRHGIVWPDLYASALPPSINQGDILTSIDLALPDMDGTLALFSGPAMLLSRSCDFDHDSHVILAACRPFVDYAKTGAAGYLKKNTVLSKLYLERVPTLGTILVDLSAVGTVRVDTIQRDLQAGRLARVSSFTMSGYYLLVAKLTAHLLRPHGLDEIRGTSTPTFRRRLVEATRQLGPLLRYVATGR